ncbi:MAG: serine protease [Ferruginibacter sp.]
MFIDAIEKVAQFTRPLNTIQRTYGANQVIPGSSTLFFVNNNGYAVTCRHVIEMLSASETINQNFHNYKTERNKIPNDGKQKAYIKGLELKYKYNPETIIQLKNTFVDCVDTMSGFTWHSHPKFDIAILKFNDFNKLHYSECAKFVKDTTAIKQGKFLCRLGFPFPEFTNFTYNQTNDDIEWTSQGVSHSPRFPIEGMVTRFLAEENQLYGIEMSTPGLRGQSGGPLFDEKGRICGMQFSTKHLHLGFDLVDKELLINNKVKKISDYSFLHLGQCIHADTIKAFLKEHNVEFYEE